MSIPRYSNENKSGRRGSQGIVPATDACKNPKAAAAEATHLLQHTCTAAAKGATDCNLKVIEIARTNANSALDYAHDLMGVRLLSDLVELSTAQTRKHFEAVTAQTKELTELAQKVTTAIAEQLKTGADDISEMTPEEEVLLLHALE